jgi:two-component system alkaline phosphatase synthesis response regulator PhoP
MRECEEQYPRKILIADDDPFVLRVLKLKLENNGYEVLTAVNGMDAQEKFVTDKPSIVITDINMPRMNGQELCEMIQEHEGKNPFCIIVMTASLDNAIRMWADKIRHIHFLEKPISPRKILGLVNQYFTGFQDCNAEL